jgi:dihydroneopterin aldolase
MSSIRELNIQNLHRRRIDPLRQIFVRDLVLLTHIGVHSHEKLAPQRIRVNLELTARLDEVLHDELRNTICYDDITKSIRLLAQEGHIELVETFAERVLHICLADPRTRRATVTVEKLDVYDDVDAVGVTISGEAG